MIEMKPEVHQIEPAHSDHLYQQRVKRRGSAGTHHGGRGERRG